MAVARYRYRPVVWREAVLPRKDILPAANRGAQPVSHQDKESDAWCACLDVRQDVDGSGVFSELSGTGSRGLTAWQSPGGASAIRSRQCSGDFPFRERTDVNPGTGQATSREAVFNVAAKT